ncbi:hypothetical protein D3C73_1319940 [compost metagenome]
MLHEIVPHPLAFGILVIRMVQPSRHDEAAEHSFLVQFQPVIQAFLESGTGLITPHGHAQDDSGIRLDHR